MRILASRALDSRYIESYARQCSLGKKDILFRPNGSIIEV